MKVVFLVGPTASGKSELALQLAKKANGVIVNCDSVQCYKHLDIGSAKPSAHDMSIVPHYLYSFVKPLEQLTAGDYSRKVHELLLELKSKKCPFVFLVGGTGFYFQAVEKGLFPVAPKDFETTQQLSIELQAENGQEILYKELIIKDSEAAKKIKPQDHFRLIRALEFIRVNNKKWSQVQQEFEAIKNEMVFPYPLIKLGLWVERPELELRVRHRTEKMLSQGLIEEVESLISKGWESWAALNSVGYYEVRNHLLSLSSGCENSPKKAERIKLLQSQIVTSTLQLSKKQKTWFKRDPNILWSRSLQIENQIEDFLLKLV